MKGVNASLAPSPMEEAMILALQSTDLRTRASAITKAAHMVDPQELVDAVGDPSDAIRRNAAIDALTRAGPRGVPTLIRALRHDDVEVVMFAAGILGKTRDASAVPHLMGLLDHDDINVAQGAIESLARLRASASVEALIGMLHRDPWIRFAAVHALGEIGDPRAVDSLRGLLEDEDIGDAVVLALGRIGSPEALAVLAELLTLHCAEEERFGLCLRAMGEALGQQPDDGRLARQKAWAALGGPEASNVHLRLLRVLTSEHETEISSSELVGMKTATVEVIRALRLKPLYGALVRAGRDPLLHEPLQFCIVSLGAETASALAIGLLSPDASVRVLACQSVGALALPDLAPRLDALLGDRQDEVRAAAADAVARVNRELAIPSLVRLLGDPGAVVRDAAVAALKQMDAESVSLALASSQPLSAEATGLALEIMRANPHPSQLPMLKRTLGDPSPTLRAAAVSAIARHSVAELVDLLRPLLADPVVDVRREAIMALGQSRSIQARELLLHQIASDQETRAVAIRTLGELGDCAVAPLLAGMLENETPFARIAILGALAELRDPAAEPLLVRALADKEPEVRRCAVEALARFATPTAIRHGLAAARDPEWQVRAAAIELLAATDAPASLAALERLCFDTNAFVAGAARRRLDEKSPL